MNTEQIQDIYPLSPMQQGMLFHSIYSPESGTYVEQTNAELRGALNINAFANAWRKVVERNPILRTAFVWEGVDEPLQVVLNDVDFEIRFEDWREKSPHQQQTELQGILEQDRQSGFVLTEAPLMRIMLFQLQDELFKMVWSHHHLLLDGWSQPLLMGELLTLYDAFDKNRSIDLPERPEYRQYIDWLEAQDTTQAEHYWQQTLAGFTSPTPLLADYSVMTETNDYATLTRMLSPELSKRLYDFAHRTGITLNTLVQAVWSLVLSRYSNEREVVFGATVSGRPPELPGADMMLGLFINTLPVRVTVDPKQPLLQWLKELQAGGAESRRFEYSSLVQIKKWLGLPGDRSLFDSILVFESYPTDDSAAQQQRSVTLSQEEHFSRTNFPLTFVCSPGKPIGFEIAYECDRFSERAIARMLEHVELALDHFVAHADQPLDDFLLLTEEETENLFRHWNGPVMPFPEDKTAHGVFEDIVRQYPDHIALYFQGHTLTYRELNERANQMARYVKQRGVHDETLVAICMDRSLDMIVALLGVLKAGGAYVPIDPNYPQERIDYMLQDSGVSLLLTQAALPERFTTFPGQLIAVDDEWQQIAAQDVANLNLNVLPQQLAYIIYTSGSTGKPKGTQLQHQGLINFIQAEAKAFDATSESQILQFASFSFDASVGEIFNALLTGATLHIAPRELLLSSADLLDYMMDQKISIVTLPPSLLSSLDDVELPHLHTLVSVGEACDWSLVQRWSRGRKFMNGYGPTETTIGAIWGEVNERDINTLTPPIGRPIENVKIYLLDPDMNPVPVGAQGQIYVGGAGVARGYWQRPDLTAERFVPNPFDDAKGERLYKTGDLARYLPDGRLVFEGRSDFQVKLRGFRIELGEIESRLDDLQEIRESVVLARDDGADKYLAAYVVPTNNNEIDTAQVAHHLKDILPDYMVPTAFVVLENFPLTPNGKVDRKALPAPDQSDRVQAEYVAPRTPTEELIVGMFQDVLKMDTVGISNNFFELGGHSLLATQLLSRLREAFAVDIPLQMVFEFPSVAELAPKIDQLVSEDAGLDAPPITAQPRTENLPLSFAQQRLWFLDQLEPNSPFYNIPLALRLSGELETEALQTSINALVQRHETLRTTFETIDGSPRQRIADTLDIPLDVQDLRHLSAEERDRHVQTQAVQEAQQPFDLAQGPLLRTRLLRLADEEYVILFTLHHIIGDGWSIAILVREMAELYRVFTANETPTLAELPIQYADFAAWQRQVLQGENLEKQLGYWRETLTGSPPLLELPTDFPRPRVQSFNGDTLGRMLPKELSEAVKAFSRQEGVTLFMTLLSAFSTLLYRYSNQDDFNIGTPIANRNRMETENLIGFFVNNLVLRCRFDEDPTFLEYLQTVRQNALQGFAHQDIPFEMLVEELHPDRDLSYSPLFQVVFVMQNTPMGGLELPDLTIEPVDAETKVAKFDLSLEAAETPEGIYFQLEYNTDLYLPETAERLLYHLELLLKNALSEPEQQVSDIEFIPEGEEQLILRDWNDSDVAFDEQHCAHEIVELFAQSQPEAVAATFGDVSLTYRELNAKANQLARYLRQQSVGLDSLVGISVKRSVDQVVAVLATLKAGAAFVPIDPTYPEDRIAYMLQDSKIPVLLTQQDIAERLPTHSATSFCLDSDWSQVKDLDSSNLELPVTPSNLAYVIYTSGSTGKPKGTMLQHQGMLNLAAAQKKAFHIEPGTRILQFAPMSFDASVWETVMALLNGATLCLTDQESLTTGDGLLHVLQQQRINVVTLPPSVLSVVPKTELPDLHTIVTAGEKCTADLVDRWLEGRQYFNAYGPTETTVCASWHLCDGSYPQGPPIGRPIDNAKLYILDSNFNPTPIGVAGELCIGGPSLARGYLNRPDLTAEKFIPNPFADDGSRLYRTGDLVRYLFDGNIEFLGRIDHQVKVRGFRIELGEIESVLDDHPAIKNVIVLPKQVRADDVRLVAYIVVDAEQKPSVNDLRHFMSQRLPDYMVPATFVFLESMPLTPSGKIDRHALPMPDLSRPELHVEYVAPRNDTEEKLVEICKDLLRIDKVGVNDNFFDLGGHSLLATQFMSRMRDQFSVELPLRVLFEKPTVAGLAEAVEEAKMTAPKEDIPAIKAVSRDRRRRKLSDIKQD
mgnify:CR=1 FL=1